MKKTIYLLICLFISTTVFSQEQDTIISQELLLEDLLPQVQDTINLPDFQDEVLKEMEPYSIHGIFKSRWEISMWAP